MYFCHYQSREKRDFFIMNHFSFINSLNDRVTIRGQHCPNILCCFYRATVSGNVVVKSQKEKRLQCKSCGQTWVSRRNEITYGLRSEPSRVQNAILALRDGVSIRKTALLFAVSPTTVQRWKRKSKKFIIF